VLRDVGARLVAALRDPLALERVERPRFLEQAGVILESTFQLASGIGPTREQWPWRAGIAV
jgi:hypothetical protein